MIAEHLSQVVSPQSLQQKIEGLDPTSLYFASTLNYLEEGFQNRLFNSDKYELYKKVVLANMKAIENWEEN